MRRHHSAVGGQKVRGGAAASGAASTMRQAGAAIFCDGACRGNGTARAIAGWAWALWTGPVAGAPAHWAGGRPPGAATNQRAELTALLEALRAWSGAGGGPVTIYTDSMYAIQCTTVWGPSWARKGWRRDSGEPLQNLDIIQPLVALWRPVWRLEHVRGHQTGGGWKAYGNDWVDRAAVAVAAAEGTMAVPVSAPIRLAPAPAPALAPAAAAAFVTAADTIEVVEDAEMCLPPKGAHRVPGLARPVYQTDLRSWFS